MQSKLRTVTTLSDLREVEGLYINKPIQVAEKNAIYLWSTDSGTDNNDTIVIPSIGVGTWSASTPITYTDADTANRPDSAGIPVGSVFIRYVD